MKEENDRARIIGVLDEVGVKYKAGPDNMFYVEDEKTARRVRTHPVPGGPDPGRHRPLGHLRHGALDHSRTSSATSTCSGPSPSSWSSTSWRWTTWTTASVTLVVPKKELFEEDQKPMTASVIITPKPGSDIGTNRKKIEGIQKLIKFAVAGLKDENIVITDQNGIQLNDFDGLLDVDRLELASGS